MRVSLADYRRCVQAQVEFLVEYAGVVQVRDVAHDDVRECWSRGVSVDACADSLTR